MDGLAILVAGLFLDFAAALTPLMPIPKVSSILRLISTLQQTAVLDDSGQSADLTFSIQDDRSYLKKISEETTKYEEQLFPYGMAFLVVGFVLVVVGVMAGS